MTDLTLDDIARIVGVSRASVSRVINNHPNVSNAMRHRVQKVIDETNFQPNLAARSLVSRRTNLLGLVIPSSVHGLFTDPYFPRLVEGISQTCNQNGHTLSLFLFHDEQDEIALFPKVTRKGFLDGIIVQSTGLGDSFAPSTSAWNIPNIFVGRPMHDENISYIDVENRAGAYNAVTHLAQLGHQRIATLTGALNTTPGQDRLEGYRRAIKASGLELDEQLIFEGDFSEASSFYGTKELLAQKPDAIFAASDTMAIGVLKALREAKQRVPEDIALVGFDDLPHATITSPQLTTVRQPIREFGSKAVETLLDIINNGPEPPRRIIFSTELVIRESCGSLYT